MILVTGATGNVGGEVVQALVRAGEPVRALVRAPADLPVEQAVGDLDRPGSLATALDGVRGVFLLPGYRDMPGLLARLRQAGAERVVLLSSLAAVSADTRNAVSQYMIRSETAVRESGLDWTILRPNAFMSNALRWLPQLRAGDVVADAFGDVPIASTDPYDIAAVAVRALLDPGHDGHVYPLSGPERLLPAQRLAVLADVLGRDLRFRALSDEEARADMAGRVPEEYIRALFGFYGDGTLDESRIHPTVAKVTGTPPRTFRQWALAHRAAFTGDADAA
ncbi:NAD(P)H-binding protein [Planomonospora parontospora]|uniref:NAD(P)H-binding protein n=1 Tax=Planomonospora parontospora TaxID=58119 RepID=UPI00166FF6BC|nr:NAD(P)H-binding protein [Planomonospora parontospora]GGL57239.1 nucleotide-diphosphate-sugar epimerase [Planomonospora parontospora subsp. antibiotica]GII20031.1 nucleotide-diphosphate-sugar epimerase [Planomonospora parontospora subsp. antibiotica]